MTFKAYKLCVFTRLLKIFITYLMISVFFIPHSFAASKISKLKFIPLNILTSLQAGKSQQFIVEFNDNAIQLDISKMLSSSGLQTNNSTILNYKMNRYFQLKNKALSILLTSEYSILKDYPNLPLSFIEINSKRGLTLLANQAIVKAVYPNEIRKANFAQALPLINFPFAAPLGATGIGTTVAVLDSGLDYTNPTFGCTAPGIPASCKVIHAEDISINDGLLDNIGHGTDMASIVTTVAPQANIVALDVFITTTSTDDATVIAGINRSITLNKTNNYNIQTINLSLGGPSVDTSCAVYNSPALAALNAGIVIFASAGNGASSQISCPANNSNIVSVGAVYDANVGGLTFTGKCTDATTAPDKIACFSNGKSKVDLFAPGALITINGVAGAGTSQACAFVSGSAALINNALPFKTAYPNIGSWVNSLKTRILTSDVTILDSVTGLTAPRINLATALTPPNNDFTNADTMSASLYTATNINATTEVGEPNHAGNIGRKSIWIKLSNTNDNVKIDSHGSNFDTLIAVYTGSTVSGLNLITSNDDDGSIGGKSSISLNKITSQNYYLAVSGKNNTSGYVAIAEQILAPANDNFNAAQSITGNNGSLIVNSSSNSLATIESNEPNHAGQISQRSVWFTWVAPQNGQTTIDTHGSNFDTLLAIYTGSTISTLTPIASNDNDGYPNGTSSVNFYAITGQTYQIAVAKKSGSTGTGTNIKLNWTSNSAVFIDEDIPTLPEWALIILSLLLLLSSSSYYARRQRDVIE